MSGHLADRDISDCGCSTWSPCWSVSGTRNGVTDRALLQRLCDPLVYGLRGGFAGAEISRRVEEDEFCACDSAVEVVGAVFRIHLGERNDSVPTVACLNRKQEVCVEVCLAESISVHRGHSQNKDLRKAP